MFVPMIVPFDIALFSALLFCLSAFILFHPLNPKFLPALSLVLDLGNFFSLGCGNAKDLFLPLFIFTDNIYLYSFCVQPFALFILFSFITLSLLLDLFSVLDPPCSCSAPLVLSLSLASTENDIYTCETSNHH